MFFFRCAFQAALSTEDPQYQEKRMVAQRNGKLSVQVFHVWIDLFCVLGNCFFFHLLLCFIFIFFWRGEGAVGKCLVFFYMLLICLCRCMWGGKKKLSQICFLICAWAMFQILLKCSRLFLLKVLSVQ